MGLLNKIKSSLFSNKKDYYDKLTRELSEMKNLQADLLNEIAESIRKTKNSEYQLENCKKRIIELEKKAKNSILENNIDNAKHALKLRNHTEIELNELIEQSNQNIHKTSLLKDLLSELKKDISELKNFIKKLNSINQKIELDNKIALLVSKYYNISTPTDFIEKTAIDQKASELTTKSNLKLDFILSNEDLNILSGDEKINAQIKLLEKN